MLLHQAHRVAARQAHVWTRQLFVVCQASRRHVSSCVTPIDDALQQLSPMEGLHEQLLLFLTIGIMHHLNVHMVVSDAQPDAQ